MGRIAICSFAGAGIGFLVAFAIGLLGDALSYSDGQAIFLFIGVFLAGTGAIAGAIVGGAADLLAFFKRRELPDQTQEQCKSNTEA
jgi:uncharacterized membrane protein